MKAREGCLEGANEMLPEIRKGGIWRSAKTWWRVVFAEQGRVGLEGPRGCVRSSLDGGKTWSEPFTTMTADGFRAWIRKSNAMSDEP